MIVQRPTEIKKPPAPQVSFSRRGGTRPASRASKQASPATEPPMPARRLPMGLAVLLAGLPLLADAGTAAYTVRVDDALQALSVQACFQDPPGALIARDERAPDLLREPRLRVAGEGEPKALVPDDATLELPAVSGPACAHYRVDLRDLGPGSWRSRAWRAHDAVLIDPHLWLWFPDRAVPPDGIRLAFELPAGFDVSAPWPRLEGNGDRPRFTLREHFEGWDSLTAIGRFRVERVQVAGAVLRLAVLPGRPAPDRPALRDWVAAGAQAVATAYGRFPVPEAQVLVVPVGRSSEAVPWGQVRRAGGDAVHLFVDQTRPLEQLMDDWVLVHELAHLLHPFVWMGDRWLPEGLASYYQNVLRARAGLIGEQAAWEELTAGFQRGRRQTRPGHSLASVSEAMPGNHMYMRVYWSGAAIALLADLALRERSGGTRSLDTALAALADCCLPSTHRWSAPELMSRLDELTGTEVFTHLYREHAGSDRFPDLERAYRRLGLIGDGEGLRLDPAAPAADLRRAIMRGPGR